MTFVALIRSTPLWILPFELSVRSFPLSGCYYSQRIMSVQRGNMLVTSGGGEHQLAFTPERQWMEADPKSLVSAKPRLAKDENFATAVQNEWKSDVTKPDQSSVGSPITYQDHQGTNLYGHVVMRPKQEMDAAALLPGILFFHTGAGPHDVTLRWKADILIEQLGCVVLIADILSDETGWGWDGDRSKYNQQVTRVLTPNADGVRDVLQSRIKAALETLCSIPGVDRTRLGALGWCLGGHSILELGRMRPPGVLALVSYHGVFDGVPSTLPPAGDGGMLKVLICHGKDDPFVKRSALDESLRTFQGSPNDCQVQFLEFDGVKHGFTNPAQDFNPNKAAFVYNKDAAIQSWEATTTMLKACLLD